MSFFKIDLNDKVALITGGTRGIGKAISESFIAAGAIVLITGTKNDEIEALNKTEATSKVNYLYLDFSVEESVSDFINKSLPKYHVDILINNAGINKIDLNRNIVDELIKNQSTTIDCFLKLSFLNENNIKTKNV